MTMMANLPPELKVPEPMAVLLSTITGFADIPQPVMTRLVVDSKILESMHNIGLPKVSDIKNPHTLYEEPFIGDDT